MPTLELTKMRFRVTADMGRTRYNITGAFVYIVRPPGVRNGHRIETGFVKRLS